MLTVRSCSLPRGDGSLPLQAKGDGADGGEGAKVDCKVFAWTRMSNGRTESASSCIKIPPCGDDSSGKSLRSGRQLNVYGRRHPAAEVPEARIVRFATPGG
jgi:hypothetical protein